MEEIDFSEIEDEDNDQQEHFVDGQDPVLLWYSPPMQRQRWGEDQIVSA